MNVTFQSIFFVYSLPGLWHSMRKGLHSSPGWGWGPCSWSRCSGSSRQARERRSRTTESAATWVKDQEKPGDFINKRNAAGTSTKLERKRWQLTDTEKKARVCSQNPSVSDSAGCFLFLVLLCPCMFLTDDSYGIVMLIGWFNIADQSASRIVRPTPATSSPSVVFLKLKHPFNSTRLAFIIV